MKNKIFILSALILLFIILLPLALDANRVGVGVTTGVVKLEELIKPGKTYNLPSIGVVNTGEVPANYLLSITFDFDQSQLKPEEHWFSFSPQEVYLEPGESQAVDTVLKLPLKAKPGDYFAYLEVAPAADTGPGTRIGVAAATRLYFSVEPANIFQAFYYSFSEFYAKYHPWNTIVLVVIFLTTFIMIFKNKFNIQIAKKQ